MEAQDAISGAALVMKEKMKSAFTTNDQNDVRQNETIIDFENSEKQA